MNDFIISLKNNIFYVFFFPFLILFGYFTLSFLSKKKDAHFSNLEDLCSYATNELRDTFTLEGVVCLNTEFLDDYNLYVFLINMNRLVFLPDLLINFTVLEKPMVNNFLIELNEVDSFEKFKLLKINRRVFKNFLALLWNKHVEHIDIY